MNGMHAQRNFNAAMRLMDRAKVDCAAPPALAAAHDNYDTAALHVVGETTSAPRILVVRDSPSTIRTARFAIRVEG